jgi:hypothetical protein
VIPYVRPVMVAVKSVIRRVRMVVSITDTLSPPGIESIVYCVTGNPLSGAAAHVIFAEVSNKVATTLVAGPGTPPTVIGVDWVAGPVPNIFDAVIEKT